jgi:hypothetical protein
MQSARARSYRAFALAAAHRPPHRSGSKVPKGFGRIILLREAAVFDFGFFRGTSQIVIRLVARASIAQASAQRIGACMRGLLEDVLLFSCVGAFVIGVVLAAATFFG